MYFTLYYLIEFVFKNYFLDSKWRLRAKKKNSYQIHEPEQISSKSLHLGANLLIFEL